MLALFYSINLQNFDKIMVTRRSGAMDDLKEFLQSQFKMIQDEFGKVHVRLDRLENEVREIKDELVDVKRVVRESAEDILENQVEEVARHNLHEDKIRSLQETTFRIDKTVLHLKKRVEKLERQ